MTKNTSSLPSEQKGITTTPYSLKEQAAIDAINSKYTYEEVTFFLEVMHDILTDHRLCPLLRVYRLKEMIAFTHVILKLIDSPRLVVEIRKLNEFDFLDSDNEILEEESDISPVYKPLPTHIIEHVEWISYILKRKELSMVILLNSYYSKFDWYPRKPQEKKLIKICRK